MEDWLRNIDPPALKALGRSSEDVEHIYQIYQNLNKTNGITKSLEISAVASKIRNGLNDRKQRMNPTHIQSGGIDI